MILLNSVALCNLVNDVEHSKRECVHLPPVRDGWFWFGCGAPVLCRGLNFVLRLCPGVEVERRAVRALILMAQKDAAVSESVDNPLRALVSSRSTLVAGVYV